MSAIEQITFFVNNEEKTLYVSKVPQSTTLNQYLRDILHLTGTKRMCMEGGCGACVVSITKKHPITNEDVTVSVSSCLVDVFSCDCWRIETIEGLGNQSIGYHELQKVITEKHGTQCGYCTPGMIMNMYALSKSNPNFTEQDVEDSFNGNLCRCTGYRPILEAFRSLAGKRLPDVKDIEELPTCRRKCKNKCTSPCAINANWYYASSIADIWNIIRKDKKNNYNLIAGNTARGVYGQNKTYDMYINIANVKELINHTIKHDSIVLGAGLTLSVCIKLLYQFGNEHNHYSYLTKIADHIELIANVHVRNIGTIGGNLTMKHEHHEFASDIFLLLETIGAKLTIATMDADDIILTPVEYLKHNMTYCLIKEITLYPLSDSYKFESYKIMTTAQNSNALVSAGFLLKLENNIVQSASLVYECLTDTFFRAKTTENFLIGKKLFDNCTLQSAYKNLANEISPISNELNTSPEFRRQLAVSLFYKYILSICPDELISPRNKSGGLKLFRPLSSGHQEFKTDLNKYPLTEPISKAEALTQTSGEAQFITDMAELPNQLHAAFVLSDAPAHSIIVHVDTSKALMLEDVVMYMDKSDIPGKNTFMPNTLYVADEEVFCSGKVQYYHQPIGLIVAKSQEAALKAAELVQVKYEYSNEKPLITIRDVLAGNKMDRITEKYSTARKRKGNSIKHVINGEFDIGHQYHFHMETQCCNVVPTEDGFDIYPGTQQMDNTNAVAVAVLNKQANKFNISVRRNGGAFGAKISRNGICVAACLVASNKLRKPVKMWLPLSVNMKIIGKRFPCSANYEVGVNGDGKIQYLNLDFYTDYGVGENEDVLFFANASLVGTYETDTWKVTLNAVKTDTAPNTWCRAPGDLEATAVLETIMDHISQIVNKDPTEVRMANMPIFGSKRNLKRYINELRIWAKIEQRQAEIEAFNLNNRWMKRGLYITTTTFKLWPLAYWPVIVSIYHLDGTVAISHGGIELGQGINTKAIQMCAYILGIPKEKVSVKPSNNLVAPNSTFTGASITSEGVCFGVLKACEVLLERMKPIKRKMPKASWEKLVEASFTANLNLTAHYLASPASPEIIAYDVNLVCATEVQVDILTGNHLIKRVDIVEDAGDSMNPAIDIGQVEGAFVMGLGYWTTEQIKMTEYGKVLTNNTYTYKIPVTKDIPIDFRIRFSEFNPNPAGILHSKAVSEPPITMSCSIPLAIRRAVGSARREMNAFQWYKIDGPSTVENTFLNSLHDSRCYTL